LDHITQAYKSAVARVIEEMRKPQLDAPDDVMTPDVFDPWDLFPCLYGSYSKDFDDMALDVLRDIRAGDVRRDDLASQMFREMLCTANLCDYGTSPRVCFATEQFKEVLPALIEKWEAYSLVSWGAV